MLLVLLLGIKLWQAEAAEARVFRERDVTVSKVVVGESAHSVGQ